MAERRVVLDYYLGAYGPTLRVDTVGPVGLARIRQAIAELAEGTVEEVDFLRFNWIVSETVERLVGRLSPWAMDKTLYIEARPGGRPSFSWVATQDHWQAILLAIDELAAHAGPAHQYLTVEQLDDALIELSLGEAK